MVMIQNLILILTIMIIKLVMNMMIYNGGNNYYDSDCATNDYNCYLVIKVFFFFFSHRL